MNRRSTSFLYVSDAPTVSGAEIVFLNYLQAFAPPAFRTHVFFRASNVRLLAEVQRRGLSYTSVETFSRTPIRTTLNPRELAHFASSIVRTARSLARVIRERDVDLVHTTMYPASLYVGLACRMTGRRQIWHEHNIKHIHAVNRWIYRWVGRSCCSVIGPSDAVTTRLLRAGIEPEKVRTLYNGIDLAAFDRTRVDVAGARRELGAADGDRLIGLFGQMLAYKGHGTLIDAAPAILRDHPRAKFFFVGALENPPYEAALRERLRNEGLESRFTFTGWRQNVPALMAAMDVVVVPTLTPEPAALSLMEGMALQRPLVATRTGGTAELVIDGETGLLFEPGDAAALARLVSTLLADDALAARLGRAGRRRMEERFSLERHLAEVETLYRECLNEDHRWPSRTAAPSAV
jgi:glycosyltransferase involved in cell wall biosynthesis